MDSPLGWLSRLLSFAKKPLKYVLILYYVGKQVLRIRNEGIRGEFGGRMDMCMYG